MLNQLKNNKNKNKNQQNNNKGGAFPPQLPSHIDYILNIKKNLLKNALLLEENDEKSDENDENDQKNNNNSDNIASISTLQGTIDALYESLYQHQRILYLNQVEMNNFHAIINTTINNTKQQRKKQNKQNNQKQVTNGIDNDENSAHVVEDPIPCDLEEDTVFVEQLLSSSEQRSQHIKAISTQVLTSFEEQGMILPKRVKNKLKKQKTHPLLALTQKNQ